MQPLIWNERTGRLVAGHQRLDALVALGRPSADVVVVDLDPERESALSLALNKISGEWDEQLLARELAALNAAAPALVAATGFSTLELEQMLAVAAAAAVANHEPVAPRDPQVRRVAVPKGTVTRDGDLWLVGRHRVLCGDSRLPSNLDRVLGGERAALLSTDPPYGVAYTGMNRPADGTTDWSEAFQDLKPDELDGFLEGLLTAVLPRLVQNAAIYMWHSSTLFPIVDRVLARHKIRRHQQIVWVKPRSAFGYSVYRWQHEPCVFGWQEGHEPAVLAWLEGHRPDRNERVGIESTVWQVGYEGVDLVGLGQHPTQKPARLFELPMLTHTERGALVLEPFSGSGSQLLAAERLERRCAALDVAPMFIDLALLRLRDAFGLEARLEADGRTFDQVAAERLAGAGPK